MLKLCWLTGDSYRYCCFTYRLSPNCMKKSMLSEAIIRKLSGALKKLIFSLRLIFLCSIEINHNVSPHKIRYAFHNLFVN